MKPISRDIVNVYGSFTVAFFLLFMYALLAGDFAGCFAAFCMMSASGFGHWYSSSIRAHQQREMNR